MLTLTITPVALAAPGTFAVSLHDLPGAPRDYAITVTGAEAEYPSVVTLPIGSASVLFRVTLAAETKTGQKIEVTATQIVLTAHGTVTITPPPVIPLANEAPMS